MAEPVLWVREDHTKAKHELLLAFFNKWVSVHSGHFTSRGGGLVRVYDGFAGPGEYSGHEPGSPKIMLDALLRNPNLRERWSCVSYEFAFVECDPRRAMRLRTILTAVERTARSEGRCTAFLKTHVKGLTLAPAEGTILTVSRPPGISRFPNDRGIKMRFV